MLQSDEDQTTIKTIAKWDSLDHWKKFWHESKHAQMRSMHDLGKRISVEIFREVDDFTSKETRKKIIAPDFLWHRCNNF